MRNKIEEVYKAWRNGTLTDAEKEAIIDEGFRQRRHSGIPQTLAEDNEDAARCHLRGESDWTVPNYYSFATQEQLIEAQKGFEKFRKDIQDILGKYDGE